MRLVQRTYCLGATQRNNYAWTDNPGLHRKNNRNPPQKRDTPGSVAAQVDPKPAMFMRAVTADQRSHSESFITDALVFWEYVRAEILSQTEHLSVAETDLQWEKRSAVQDVVHQPSLSWQENRGQWGGRRALILFSRIYSAHTFHVDTTGSQHLQLNTHTLQSPASTDSREQSLQSTSGCRWIVQKHSQRTLI